MEVSLKTENLTEATQAVLALPGIFTRARRSAMSSTGWMIMSELRNHIEYGGSNWAPLHPLTLRLRKYRGAGPSPLFYLGRFARYQVDPDALSVKTDLGKGYARSQSGKSLGWSTYREKGDPWLTASVLRAEEGATVPVTRAMRKLWLTTKHEKTRRGTPGKDYFALRKSTMQLRIPKRPIFGPVFDKIQGGATAHFEQKFWEAFARYSLKGIKT